MSVVALVIAPSISINLDGKIISNTSDKDLLVDNSMNTNGTFVKNGVIVLVSEDEVEFDSKVKYSSSENIIESININLMKKIKKSNLSSKDNFMNAESLKFQSFNVVKFDVDLNKHISYGILTNGDLKKKVSLLMTIQKNGLIIGEIDLDN